MRNDFRGQQQNGNPERPLVTLMRPFDEFFFRVRFWQRRKPIAIQRFHSLGPSQGIIDRFRLTSDPLQQLLVQVGFYDIPLLIAYVIGAFFGIFHAQEFAFFGADANSKNPKASLGRFFGRFQRVGIVVFPIGDEDHDSMIVGFFERGRGGFNGIG